jgi:hypothetical protein
MPKAGVTLFRKHSRLVGTDVPAALEDLASKHISDQLVG